MARLKVTKRQILKAIAIEPLAAGAFFHDEENFTKPSTLAGTFKNNSKCAVCVIGGILDLSMTSRMKRMPTGMLGVIASRLTDCAYFSELAAKISPIALIDGYELEGIAPGVIPENVKDLIQQCERHVYSKPLSALSSLFEALSKREEYRTSKGMANYRIRRILSSFVKRNFPSKLTLDTTESY